VADTCIRHKPGFFSGAGKADEPVWVIFAIVLAKDSDEMPLITPS
jgi:hypothetical protein